MKTKVTSKTLEVKDIVKYDVQQKRDDKKKVLLDEQSRISKELKVIQDQEYKEKLAERVTYNRRLLEAKPVLIQLLEHSRTSCSDQDPNNGDPHYEGGGSRCYKCLFMQLEEWNLEQLSLILTVEGFWDRSEPK